MDAAIDIPPFPPLTWDKYSWSGEARLPSWAGFQNRRRAYGSLSVAGPSDGTARLTVEAKDKALPTPEQAAAFRHLIENESSVAEAVASALLDYYPGERLAYLDAYDLTESEELPEVTDRAGLRRLGCPVSTSSRSLGMAWPASGSSLDACGMPNTGQASCRIAGG